MLILGILILIINFIKVFSLFLVRNHSFIVCDEIFILVSYEDSLVVFKLKQNGNVFFATSRLAWNPFKLSHLPAIANPTTILKLIWSKNNELSVFCFPMFMGSAPFIPCFVLNGEYCFYFSFIVKNPKLFTYLIHYYFTRSSHWNEIPK